MERRQGNKTHTRPREREREYENTTHPPLHSALGHSHEPRGCTAPHSLFLHIPVTTPLQTSYLLCASQSSFSFLFTSFPPISYVVHFSLPLFFSLWGREKISRITRKCVRTLSCQSLRRLWLHLTANYSSSTLYLSLRSLHKRRDHTPTPRTNGRTDILAP